MEAYGFMKTVERFCERELICITKIISDNKVGVNQEILLINKCLFRIKVRMKLKN